MGVEKFNELKFAPAAKKTRGADYAVHFLCFLCLLFIGSDIYSIDVLGVTVRLEQIFLLVLAAALIIRRSYNCDLDVKIFAFMLSALLSTIFAFDVKRAALYYLSVIYNVFIIYFVFASYVRAYGLKKFIFLFRATLFVQFALLLAQYFSTVAFGYDLPFMPNYGESLGVWRFQLWFFEPSYLCTFLAFWFMIACHMVLSGRDKSYIADVYACTTMFFISTSTTGFIALAAAIAVAAAIWFGRGFNKNKLLLIPVVVVSLALYYLAFRTTVNGFVGRLFNSSLNDASGGRVSNWAEGWSVFISRPVLGVGAGNFGLYLGFGAEYVPSNLTVDLLATLGICGLVTFYCLNLALVVKCYTVYRARRCYTSELALGCALGLLLFVLVLQVNQGYLRLYHWLFMGVLEGYVKSNEVKKNNGDYLNERVLLVDGKFLVEDLTGVQRVAYELIRELVKIKNLKVVVVAQKGAALPEDFPEEAEVVYTGRFKGHLWEQISLPLYCAKRKLPLLCTGNLAPALYKNSYVILHDVIYNEPNTLGKSWVIKRKILNRAFIYRIKLVLTVSEFSKERILHFYPKLKREPEVLYNGWEHIARIPKKPCEGVTGEFYLSVGSANPNKNFKYVLALAKNNPDKQFIITGLPKKEFTDYLNENGVKNCRFLGYVSDGELMWLYDNCTGFILPSVYEGFGVPPIEALAAGCRRLYLSDIPPLKEIYGGAATFFNPNDYDNTVNLDGGERAKEEEVQRILNKYSWKHSAEKTEKLIFRD